MVISGGNGECAMLHTIKSVTLNSAINMSLMPIFLSFTILIKLANNKYSVKKQNPAEAGFCKSANQSLVIIVRHLGHRFFFFFGKFGDGGFGGEEDGGYRYGVFKG